MGCEQIGIEDDIIVEYFDNYGRNIAIQDRFGNTITIDHTIVSGKVQKIQITDTLDNVVVYEEVPVDNTTTNYAGPSGHRVQYNKMWKLSLNGNVVRKYYSYVGDSATPAVVASITKLVGVENEVEELTKYSSITKQVFYNCFVQPTQRESNQTNTGKFHVTDSPDVLVSLNMVTYPNRCQEILYYDTNPVQSFGGNGYHHYIRYRQLNSLNSAPGSSSSYSTYTYGNFDGLELDKHWPRDYETKVEYWHSYPIIGSSSGSTVWKDYDLTYTFNNSAQNTKIKKLSYSAMPLRQEGIPSEQVGLFKTQTSWESQIVEYTYENGRVRWPETVTTKYKDASSGKELTRAEEYTYDSKGNVLTYKKPNKQTETYTYDPNYSILLTSTFKQKDDTTIKVTNALAGGKAVGTTVTTSNDVQVSKSEFTYNDAWQLTEQKDYRSADANDYVTTTYTYGNAAQPIQVTVSGVKTASGTPAAGSVISSDSSNPVPGTVARKQTYNDRGWITSETDANGNTTTYTYDGSGRIESATHPNGESLSYVYLVATTSSVTYTDEAGNQWKCDYGRSGKLLRVTDLTNNQLLQTNTYDRNDQLIKQVIYGNTTPNQTTYYRYDTDGRLIDLERVDASGNTLYQELYKYEDGAGKVTKTVVGDTNAPSVVTTTYQDNMGNTVKTGIVRNGKEEETLYSYDLLGNQTQALTEFSKGKNAAYTTSTTYNYAGQPLSVVDADGNMTSYTYDWLGNQLTMTAPKDQNTDPSKTQYHTTNTYDALGRLIRVETPIAAGHTGRTDYTYDANGNVTQERTLTGAKGNTSLARITNYTYDNMNRLTQVQGNAKQNGQSGADRYQYTKYTYDPLGNIATMSVGAGSNWETTGYTYDRYSRLLTQTDPLGQTQRYTYDPLNGNLTSKKDRRGVTTSYTYDALGRLTGSTAGTASVAFTYTKTGQRRTATSNGETTTYTYNSAGDLLKEVSPNATKTMTYGTGGVRNRFTVVSGGKTYLDNHYNYDKLGHLTEVEYGNASTHYSYDSNGNVNNVTSGVENLKKATTSYTYNKANLVTEVKNKYDKTNLSNFKYTYGADGNQLSKIDVLQGVTTNYTYDGLNRLTQEGQTGTDGFTNTYTYDDFSNRSQAVLAGATASYAYDSNNRLLSVAGDMTASYTYDGQGNQTQSTLTLEGQDDQVRNYTYDGFGRLIKVRDNDGETVYTYDADGLRSSKATSVGIENYVYDNGQLVVKIMEPIKPIIDESISNAAGKTVSLSLETGRWYYGEINGVLFSAQAEDYTPQVELFATPIGGGTERPETPVGSITFTRLMMGDVCFVTDPDAGETTVTGPVGTEVALYNSDPSLVQLVDVSYIRGLGLVAAKEGSELTFYHYNAHGDVVQLTDANGNIIRDYTYDAFGVEQDADETDANPFRYCGEQYDSETGNYYLRARYYTPGVGSFTQEDPVMDGLNWYGYCAGNPVAFVDPSGLVLVGLRAYAGTYDGAVVGWDGTNATVTYQGKTLSVEATPENTRDCAVYVDDSLFVQTFGMGSPCVVYQDEVTKAVSIRATFNLNKLLYAERFIVEPTEDSPGITYGEAFLSGVEEGWSGTHGGYEISTYVGRSRDGIRVNFEQGNGVSMTVHRIPWGRHNLGTITMYPGDIRNTIPEYTLEEYKSVAAHEFGHILGVGDAYNASEDSKKVRSIFNDFGTPLQGIDVEMMLRAWSQNQWQSWP